MLGGHAWSCDLVLLNLYESDPPIHTMSVAAASTQVAAELLSVWHILFCVRRDKQSV